MSPLSLCVKILSKKYFFNFLILYPELLFPFLVLDAFDASSGTCQNEIARLGEKNKKLVGLQQKLDQSQRKNEKKMCGKARGIS